MRDIKWQEGPVPSAELVHPDNQIIICCSFQDKEIIEILSPYVMFNKFTHLSNYSNYWMNDKKQLWAPQQLVNVHWDWWKSFHRE